MCNLEVEMTVAFDSLRSQRIRRSRGTIQSRRLIFCLMLLSSGCGRTPAPVAIRESAAVEVAAAAAGSLTLEDVPGEERNESETSQPPLEASEVTQPTAAVQAESTAAANSNDAPNASPAPQVTVAIKPVIDLSPEQLARWARSSFEPFQLLACREPADIGMVTNIADLNDGRHYILAGSKVSLWSIGADAPEYTFLDVSSAGEEQAIQSLAVAPNGKWIAVGNSAGLIRTWRLEDRSELHAKQFHSNDITQIAISPDSSELATTSYDNEVMVWSADELEQKNRFKIETNGLKRIMYASQDKLVAAGETTTSWNTRTGKQEQTLSPGRYNYTLARSADGSRFAVGDEDGLQFWDAREAKLQSRLRGDFASEEWVEFSDDGKLLITANGTTIRVWDLSTGQVLQVIDAYGWPIVGMKWLPSTQLLVVASLNGRTRIWGAPKAAEPLGFRPLQAAVALPDEGSRKPATQPQLLAAIDLRSFPRLPGPVPQTASGSSLTYTAPVTQEEAKTFYRYHLAKDGWIESPSGPLTPGAIAFRKGGCVLTASFSDDGDSKTTMSLHHAGNYDLRWAPNMDAAPIEMVYENMDTVLYRTKADLVLIETNLIRRMHDAGWTSYSRLNASQSEEPDRRDLGFLQGGAALHVSVGRFPAEPSSYHVQSGRYPLHCSLPIPADSGFVEFDGSIQPNLVASTAMTLVETRDFYDRELDAEGWTACKTGRSIKEDHHWLPYFRGQEDMTVHLRPIAKGGTLVCVGDGLENTSWQLAKPKSTTTPSAPAVGIEAADFPVLNASKSANYDTDAKTIAFTVEGSTLANVADRYSKQLQSMDWTTSDRGIRADDYTLLTFIKDDTEISLRARLSDGNAVVNIQGDGLLWTKALPIPPRVISYATWLRRNRRVASLKHLDEYADEMNKILNETRK